MTTILVTIGILFFVLILLSFIITLSIKFDKDHKSNVNSWHYNLFCILKCNEKYDTPTNVCQYFWEYVLYIIFIPLRILAILINLFLKDKMERESWIISIMLYFVILISYVIGRESFPDKNIPYTIFFGFIIFLLILAISIGTFIGIKYFNKKYKNRKYQRYEKQENLLFAKIKSWKERNCSIIIWNNETDK